MVKAGETIFIILTGLGVKDLPSKSIWIRVTDSEYANEETHCVVISEANSYCY